MKDDEEERGQRCKSEKRKTLCEEERREDNTFSV